MEDELLVSIVEKSMDLGLDICLLFGVSESELLMWHWELPKEIEESFLRTEELVDGWVDGREGEPGIGHNVIIRDLFRKYIRKQRELLCQRKDLI